MIGSNLEHNGLKIFCSSWVSLFPNDFQDGRMASYCSIGLAVVSPISSPIGFVNTTSGPGDVKVVDEVDGRDFDTTQKPDKEYCFKGVRLRF